MSLSEMGRLPNILRVHSMGERIVRPIFGTLRSCLIVDAALFSHIEKLDADDFLWADEISSVSILR